jgi:hypothetical protein
MQNRRRRRVLSLLTILVAFLAERRRRRHQHQMTIQTTFQASGVAVDALFFSPDPSSSSSFTSKNATTEEILAVVTVGWEISDDEAEHQAGERKARLLWQIIENYRSACKNNNNNFKRVTVALAAYVEDEARLRTFLEESSKRDDDDAASGEFDVVKKIRSVRVNGDWRIEDERKSRRNRVRMERKEMKSNYGVNDSNDDSNENTSSTASCEFAVDLELFGFREIDAKKSYMTPGDLSIRHRDIFLRRLVSDDETGIDGDKVLFIVQEDDVFIDEKHVSQFLETSKITERLNDNDNRREGKGNFYHPFFFDYEKDSDGIAYVDWRVNAGVVQKIADWNNQIVFTSSKASGGGRSLMIRGRSRLRDLIFSSRTTTIKSSSGNSNSFQTTVDEMKEWLEPLAAHPGEYNVEIATNRWIERRVSARGAEVKMLLPLAPKWHLQTFLDDAGIWHASNTYVNKRKELLLDFIPSSPGVNGDTLERLKSDELHNIFHSCLTEKENIETEEGEEEGEEEGNDREEDKDKRNECFRCLSIKKTNKAQYRARIFVAGDDDDERAEVKEEEEESKKEKKPRRRKRRRVVDVSFSCVEFSSASSSVGV